MKWKLLSLAVFCVLLLAAAFAVGQESKKARDFSGLAVADTGVCYGLAALYPGDVGLGADSAVVFHDDFEVKALADLNQRWTYTGSDLYDGRLSLVDDSIPGCPGRTSLKINIIKGEFDGASAYKLLDKGYDRLYARFYCKFAPDAPYVHHFVHLGGKTSTAAYPEGGAGNRPTGYDRFTTSIDLRSGGANPPGAWVFYSYWCDMHSWQTPQGASDGRANAYYGNVFGPPVERPEQAKRGQWQCVEMMIKMNSAPDKSDGEQAFWIDGRLVDRWAPGSHMGCWFSDRFREYGTEVYNLAATVDSIPKPFEGFRWSRTPYLKINQFDLQYYLASVFENDLRPADSTIAYNGSLGRVEFDNVVLATRYIGPLAENEWSRNDFDGDGKRSLGDVLRMVRLRAAYPEDMRTDYDGDGKLTLQEVLRMLLEVLKG